MPLYEIEHVIQLSADQKDELAKAITQIHSHLFTTPSLFVNVRFTDTSQHDVYVGGKKTSINRILAHVRPGGGRSISDFNKLCEQITSAWKHAVGADVELRAIFVLGTIVAGSEAGFALPPAGEDKKWLKENLHAFKERAGVGDEDFKDVLSEMENREDMREVLRTPC